MKEEWQILIYDQPGQRFQNYRQRHKKPEPLWKFIINILLAIISFVVALILAVAPGPAILFWIIGLHLVVPRMGFVARWLDAWEMGIRRILKRK